MYFMQGVRLINVLVPHFKDRCGPLLRDTFDCEKETTDVHDLHSVVIIHGSLIPLYLLSTL